MKSTANALTTRPVQSLVVGCMTLLPESVVSKLAHLDDERELRKSTGGLPRSTAPAGDRSPSDGRMGRPPAPSATRALPQRGRPCAHLRQPPWRTSRPGLARSGSFERNRHPATPD